MGNKNSHFVGASFGGHRFVCFLSAVLLTLVSILAGSLILTAENAAAVIDAEVYHLDMTTANYVNINLLPSPNGSIAIGASEINVTSTTPGGFGLYLSGSDTLYRNGDTTNTDADKKIISTTGTYALPISLISNSTTPATWGYAIAGVGNFDASYDTVNPSIDAKFAAVPATNSEQLIKTENSTVSNDTTTIYYGINANTNLTSGEYISGAVSYYSVADISSLIGGELTVSPSFITPGQENTIEITTSLNTTMDLGEVDVTIGNASCVSKTITSTTPLTITCVLPDTITWGHHDVEVDVSKFGRNYSASKAVHALYAMQNVNAAVEAQMVPEQQYQFYDLRDNKIYFASKLADGNIWMTQNLDFEIPTTGIYLTTDTTEVEDNRTLTAEATWSTNDFAINYRDGGDIYYQPNLDDITQADTVGVTDDLDVDDPMWHYHVGSYYSMAAATGGDAVTYDITTYSICPKGWRIEMGPVGGYTISYQLLSLLYAYDIVGSSQSSKATSDLPIRSEPFYLTHSGYIHNGTFTGVGFDGYYITGTGGQFYTGGQAMARVNPVYFNSSTIELKEYDWTVSDIEGRYGAIRRSNGGSLRCVKNAPYSYVITYDSNGGKTQLPTTKAPYWTYGNNSVAILTYRQPVRVGFKFLGWSEDPNATTATYSPEQRAIINGNKTLYAVWQPEPIYQAYFDAGLELNSDGYFTMQDMTDEICAAVTTPDRWTTISSRLVDVRDGKLYYVSKLADGNCWMTQNLDFELSKDGTTLNPETSAVIAEKTIYLDEWGSGANGITYADGGDRNPYNNTTNLNTTNNNEADYNWHYHIGSYYSYAAATAGSGIDLISQNATESVCPKGWRLPIGSNFTDNKSFGKLMDTYGYTSGANGGNGSSIQSSPLFFQIGGYASSDTDVVYYRGTGFYWSASSYSAPHAFYMSFGNNSGSLAPVHSNERYVAANVRCVNGSTKQFAIHYDANGGDSAPADTVKYVLTDDATANIRLTTELPTYGQSTFLGWATTADAVTAEYAAGANFTASAEQTLYAVWDQFDVAYSNAGKTKDASGYFLMQDMTPEICDAIPTPTTAEADVPTSALVDVRDNFVYYVAKLMDGKCWMTQNLYYQIHLAQYKPLSPLTTDVRVQKEIVTNNSWNNAYHNSEYSRGAFHYDGKGNQQSGVPAVGNTQRHYVDGTIYSYSTAAAGLTEADVNAGNTTDSLCPRGWRMPMGGSNGVEGSQEDSEMGVLFNNYGVIHNRALEEEETLTHAMSPLYLTQGGQRIANQFVNVGTEAVYWQNGVGVVTEDDGEGGTVEKIYASSVFISNDLNTLGRTVAYNGGYLRCVASADTPAIVTFTPDDEITGEFVGNNIATTMAVVPVGTTYTIDGDTITFSNGAIVKAQGKYRYGYSNTFVSWNVEGTSGTITGDTEFTANFNARLLFRGITTMQEMTPEICAEAWENDSIRPIDTRDNERYWITKLADGRCWMTEDLDFEIASAENGGTTLYPATSNVTEERNIGYSGVAGNTNGYRRETHLDDNNALVRMYNNNDGVGYSGINAANLAFDDYRWHYRLGAFYGFNIATAGTGGSLAHGSNVNATESICPKGWHLPTANSGTTEYEILRASYDWAASPDNYTYRSPTYFYRNGYVSQGQSGVTDRGNYGQRWTANIDYNHYTNNTMRINGNTLSAYDWAMGVRCIADVE